MSYLTEATVFHSPKVGRESERAEQAVSAVYLYALAIFAYRWLALLNRSSLDLGLLTLPRHSARTSDQ